MDMDAQQKLSRRSIGEEFSLADDITIVPAAVESSGESMGKDRLVKMRIKMRDAKTEMKKAFELEYDKITRAEKQIDAELKRLCQEEGTSGFKTEFGTVSLVETMKASLADTNAFGEFLKTEDPLNWLTNSVKIEAIKTYMKSSEGQLPPGVSVFREIEARVRRAGEK